ncbi:uncharacterized protein LOC122944035 [Bufo gargarizans]|uniref:uncharacterized protein LOC122944035 n=1 Tax=Bufo gargarizans TaxID=30331 RepID=UPI001CF2B875|nr:uncharacterized protein LOC122944035 [Bufo gargarizans]
MKIIIFLALAGLSLAADIVPPPPMPNQMLYPVPGTAPNSEACIKNAIKAVSGLFPALTKFVCFYHGPSKYNEANLKEAIQKLADLLGATDCTLETLLGLTKVSLENMLLGDEQAINDLAKTLVGILGLIGITKPVAEAVCFLLGPLPVDCVQNLLATIDDNVLQGLLCPKKGAVTPGLLADLLMTVDSCLGGLLGSTDSTPVGDLVNALLTNLGVDLGVTVDSLLDTLRQVLKVLGLNLCPVTDLLNPLLGLVGG